MRDKPQKGSLETRYKGIINTPTKDDHDSFKKTHHQFTALCGISFVDKIES